MFNLWAYTKSRMQSKTVIRAPPRANVSILYNWSPLFSPPNPKVGAAEWFELSGSSSPVMFIRIVMFWLRYKSRHASFVLRQNTDFRANWGGKQNCLVASTIPQFNQSRRFIVLKRKLRKICSQWIAVSKSYLTNVFFFLGRLRYVVSLQMRSNCKITLVVTE